MKKRAERNRYTKHMKEFAYKLETTRQDLSSDERRKIFNAEFFSELVHELEMQDYYNFLARNVFKEDKPSRIEAKLTIRLTPNDLKAIDNVYALTQELITECEHYGKDSKDLRVMQLLLHQLKAGEI